MRGRSVSHTSLLCSCLAVLLVCAGCTSIPSGQKGTPTRSPLASSTPLVVARPQPTPISGLLDPPPATCPASSPLQILTQDDFGGGFTSPASFLGASPVWQQGLPQSGSTLHLNRFGPDPLPGTKVLWVVGPNSLQPVTLRGREVDTGALLWFEIYPDPGLPSGFQGHSTYTTSAVLDPAAPNRGSTDNGTGHWSIFGIGLIMLTAGCYQLDVSWPRGSWQAIYAAGR